MFPYIFVAPAAALVTKSTETLRQPCFHGGEIMQNVNSKKPIYDIGTKILFQPCFGHNSTHNGSFSKIPEDSGISRWMPAFGSVKSWFKAFWAKFSKICMQPWICSLCLIDTKNAKKVKISPRRAAAVPKFMIFFSILIQFCQKWDKKCIKGQNFPPEGSCSAQVYISMVKKYPKYQKDKKRQRKCNKK